jgi:uncharacterized membrane protein
MLMLEWLKRRSARAVLALIVMLLVAGLAVSFPPDLAFLMALDVSTWVEAAVAVYVATQLTKVRPLLIFVRARLFGRTRKSPRQSRTRAITKTAEASNDDEPAAVLGFAA